MMGGVRMQRVTNAVEGALVGAPLLLAGLAAVMCLNSRHRCRTLYSSSASCLALAQSTVGFSFCRAECQPLRITCTAHTRLPWTLAMRMRLKWPARH